MPELPEVETIRRGLEPLLIGKRIARAQIKRPELCILRSPLPAAFAELDGRCVSALKRRGKYLLFELLDPRSAAQALPAEPAPSESTLSEAAPAEPLFAPRHGETLVLLMHLRMSGRCLYFAPEEMSCPLADHTHILLDLADESGALAGQLRWQDVRRFGRWELFSQGDFLRWKKGPGALGPEPFDAACNADYLGTFAARHAKLSLGALLLDQRCIAGLGNIYVQELLFRLGLHPLSQAATLAPSDWEGLLSVLKPLLAEAIGRGGTSFRDYVGATGQPGRYAQELEVYGRIGLPCTRCGRTLEALMCAGRRMAFCPNCQRRLPHSSPRRLSPEARESGRDKRVQAGATPRPKAAQKTKRKQT